MIDALMKEALAYDGDLEDFINEKPHFVNAITQVVMKAVYTGVYHMNSSFHGLPPHIYLLDRLKVRKSFQNLFIAYYEQVFKDNQFIG